MVKKDFMWHAKRGHGISFKIIDPAKDFENVEKLVLNIYIANGYDFRSEFVYELAKYFDKNDYFVDKMIKKLNRLSQYDSLVYDFLINNLYYFELNEDHWNRLIRIFKRWLNKEKFESNEYVRIRLFLKLVLEKDEIVDIVVDLLRKHFMKYPNSNLYIDYDQAKPDNYKTSKINYNFQIDEIKSLKFTEKLYNSKYYSNFKMFYYHYSTNEANQYLINVFNDCNDENIKNKIISLLCVTRCVDEKIIDFLINCLFKFEHLTTVIIFRRLSEIRSKKIKEFSYSLINTKYQLWIIPIVLNNYNQEKDFDTIKKNYV